MADWIGHSVANWPIWALVLVIIIVAIVWIFFALAGNGAELPWRREWWEDKEKRLKKEAEKRNAKLKARKG